MAYPSWFQWTNKARAVAQTKLKQWPIHASTKEQVKLKQIGNPHWSKGMNHAEHQGHPSQSKEFPTPLATADVHTRAKAVAL